jgi:hypothetical protein
MVNLGMRASLKLAKQAATTPQNRRQREPTSAKQERLSLSLSLFLFVAKGI